MTGANGRGSLAGSTQKREWQQNNKIYVIIERLTPDSRAPAKQSWHHVGPILGLCWPMLGLRWPMLGLCWPMLSHLGSYVGAMFGPSMLKRS